jgi:hypothetical protein
MAVARTESPSLSTSSAELFQELSDLISLREKVAQAELPAQACRNRLFPVTQQQRPRKSVERVGPPFWRAGSIDMARPMQLCRAERCCLNLLHTPTIVEERGPA